MGKVDCNLCKSDDYLLLFRLDNFKIPLNIVRCKGCGLIYQNPCPDGDLIKSFYSKDYYTGKSPVSYVKEFKKDVIIANERLKIVERWKPPGKLLDIGCYSGAFLASAQRRGWDSYGIEISPFIVERAKTKGLKVYLGEVSDINFKDSFFDVVTLFEVIEHLFNPLETLIEIHRILKDDGMLIIQTANMDSFRAKILKPRDYYFLPVHLYYFTKKTMIKMLKKAGFKNFKIFNGSEFNIRTEIKLFKDDLFLGRLLFRKLLNKMEFRGFTLSTVMVVYAKKS